MVTILGKEYELRFTLWAKQQFVNLYGTYKLQELMDVEGDDELYKRIIEMARVMIQAANLRSKLDLEAFLDEQELPPENCWLFMEDREIGDLLTAITQAYAKSFKMTVAVQSDPKDEATQLK